MKLQKRTGERCLNLIGSLQGAAFDTILELLDKAFAYDNRVQMPQDFENFFSYGVRKPGATMLQFCAEFDEKFRKVQAHGVKLPSQVLGWFLLKKANITQEQRQMVLTQAPGLERTKVQEALYLILGQDHKAAVITDKRPFGRGKGQRAYVVDESWEDEDVFYEGELDDYHDYDQVPIESWQDDESGLDHDAGYFQVDEPEKEEGFVAASADWDIEEYDTACATYLDVRRRFANLKLSRGYLPTVALQDDNTSQAASPPRSPSKGKEHRKGKGGKKGRSGSNTVRYPPRSGGIRCGGSGHMAANCPELSKTSSGGPSTQSASTQKGWLPHQHPWMSQRLEHVESEEEDEDLEQVTQTWLKTNLNTLRHRQRTDSISHRPHKSHRHYVQNDNLLLRYQVHRHPHPLHESHLIRQQRLCTRYHNQVNHFNFCAIPGYQAASLIQASKQSAQIV